MFNRLKRFFKDSEKLIIFFKTYFHLSLKKV